MDDHMLLLHLNWLINELVGDDQVFPASCGYHRKCYQLFTNKKNLESSKKRSIQSSDDENNRSIPRYLPITTEF